MRQPAELIVLGFVDYTHAPLPCSSRTRSSARCLAGAGGFGVTLELE